MISSGRGILLTAAIAASGQYEPASLHTKACKLCCSNKAWTSLPAVISCEYNKILTRFQDTAPLDFTFVDINVDGASEWKAGEVVGLIVARLRNDKTFSS
jgi:hypothetical protein